MRLTFLGTGSPMPVADRAQTGSLLTTDNNSRALLVDCGSGVLQRLAATEVGYEDISSVLLTHHHIDHVTDLLPLLKARWLAGETYLEIVGPAGTKRLIDDLLEIHEYLSDQIELRIREVGPTEFTVADFDIEARRTEHSLDGLAYRITEPTQEQDIHTDAQSEKPDADESATVVFSGDTEATNRIARLADGAAVLVHDCSFPDGVDVSGHPTPSQLANVLNGITVGRVYLTHLFPHTEGNHETMRERIQKKYDGEVRFARDGLTVTIDVGGDGDGSKNADDTTTE